jgi:archaellum biogenesis ATPase FlaH|tara:strand:+ start:3037 stop:4242 length:1206 start_codon:yes stop_codon:yes gene_type:complete
LSIELDNAGLAEQTHIQAHEVVDTIKVPVKDDDVWLLEQTETWCQDRAIYLAIMKSIEIIDGRDEQQTKNALPEILSNALAVSFDTNIGHDYVGSADARYEFYHTAEEKLPFDLEKFNSITKGGLPKKSLNIALAGTGVGKSLFMCHCAAGAMTDGKNVLYLTMEMSEERIAERIDANLFNVPIDQLENLSKKMFDDKVKKISSKTNGQLIIKEYPTGSAHVGHFRALLNELKLKKDFAPDIIFIDYLNICASSRIKGLSGGVNTYSLIKSIAEEIRGLAVEYNVPIVSATQTTRSGFGSSDVGLEDTSESFGLPATADLMFALISNEELEGLNQILVKQLKNRYNDPSINKRFIVGVDRARMRLYDVEDSAQNISDAGQNPAPINTFNKRETKDYGDFKV